MIDEELLLEKIELLRSKCEYIGRRSGKTRALAYAECAIIIRAMVPYDKELEQAAQQYDYNHDGLPWGESMERLTYAFKAGAQWQKQQMMKDAIPATVKQLTQNFVFLQSFGISSASSGLDAGDKVKVIPVSD